LIVDRTGTPSELLTAEFAEQGICHEPGVPTVPVWKRVNRDQAMMEPAGDFVSREGTVIDPGSSIAQQVVHLLDYHLWRHSDVLQRLPESPGPRPGVGEHPLMDFTEHALGEKWFAAATPS